MIAEYLTALLICSGSMCEWTYGSTHDEKWKCLYEAVEISPKYSENKSVKLVDCKLVTSYKHEQDK